jgi:hypothetical protein
MGFEIFDQTFNERAREPSLVGAVIALVVDHCPV